MSAADSIQRLPQSGDGFTLQVEQLPMGLAQSPLNRAQPFLPRHGVSVSLTSPQSPVPKSPVPPPPLVRDPSSYGGPVRPASAKAPAVRRSFSEGGSAEGAKAGSPQSPSPQSPVPIQDDFAAMHEVVLRRHRKLLEQGGLFPDLILIDGGKGQLSAAYAALEELGLANLVAVGIAKKEELIHTRDREDPIALAANDPALLLMQRIRDEAHRFAVTFHRRARTMRDLRSELDDVPGIGPGRRRTLLTAFGSVAGVRRATREDLAAVVGAKAADAVLAFFASRP